MTQDNRRDEAVIGSTLDRRYTLKREIARGGFGAVFEAEHMVTRARVAIKALMRPALDIPSAQARLIREARILGALRHQSIVSVFDAGTCSKHGPYVVMEMVEGRPLDGVLLTRQKLSVEQTLAVTSQLCGALSDVHRHGIVHRDVKPANILIARGPEGERVELIDFGIASVGPGTEPDGQKLTALGEVIGTVEYMAPEQLMAHAPLTNRADVYAVGAVIYECLTGDVPFTGDPTKVITDMLMISKGMSTLNLHSGMPPALERVVRRALEIHPENRQASVAELAQACLDAIGISAPSLDLLDMAKGAEQNRVQPASPSPARVSIARRYPRAPYVTPVRIITSTGTLDGRTEDISEGGVLMIVEGAVADGERVTLRMPLPVSGRVVQLEARTKWFKSRRNQRAIGTELMGASEDVLVEIRKYVAFMSGSRGAVPAV